MTTPPSALPLHSAQHDRRVDYLEFPTTDVAATRRFYEQAFGWRFTDYGPDYTSFEDGRIAGGFYADAAPGAEHRVTPRRGPLVVLFALDLADAERRVVDAGGRVVTPAYEFPGGRRFHFADPGGNELAVWSDR